VATERYLYSGKLSISILLPITNTFPLNMVNTVSRRYEKW